MLNSVIFEKEIENPFFLPSAQPVRTRAMLEKAYQAGWGGVVTQSIHLGKVRLENVSPRLHIYRKNEEMVGFINIDLITMRPYEDWLEDIFYLKKKYPQKALVASIMHIGEDPNGWSLLASECEKAGADLIELNLSCPHGVTELGAGAVIGQNPELTSQAVEYSIKGTKLPVMAKLSPNVTSIVQIAQAAVQKGINGFTLTNNLNCLAGIDLDNLAPLPSVMGFSTFGGYAGPGLKPVSLRCVAEIARKFPDKIIAGTGGISSWYEAAEYISLGAHIVQVYEKVVFDGFACINDFCQGLELYLKSKGFNTLNQFRGIMLEKISDHMSLSRDKMVAIIDYDKCTNCGKCYLGCESGGYQAINLNDNNVPVIIKAACDGCGLCSAICVPKAIKIEKS